MIVVPSISGWSNSDAGVSNGSDIAPPKKPFRPHEFNSDTMNCQKTMRSTVGSSRSHIKETTTSGYLSTLKASMFSAPCSRIS